MHLQYEGVVSWLCSLLLEEEKKRHHQCVNFVSVLFFPWQVVNCAELLSKWVGESTKNIDAIFEEARHTDAILVFDEAEGLFGSRTAMRYRPRVHHSFCVHVHVFLCWILLSSILQNVVCTYVCTYM